MTYEEMTEAGHSTETKEVNFELPGGSVTLLQQVPGFENFNPQLEVLHCDKPGTGLRDAPAAFSRKLNSVTSKMGCKPLHADSEVVVLHRNGKLVLLFGKH
eukprot:9412214-Lingulodinium_polyedra.AAC.1